jgi:hypothetical protein
VIRNEIDRYVEYFGESQRKLIEDSLSWLEEQEPKWKLKTPIDRFTFLKGLIGSKDENTWPVWVKWWFP